jgi:hypothetical protein
LNAPAGVSVGNGTVVSSSSSSALKQVEYRNKRFSGLLNNAETTDSDSELGPSTSFRQRKDPAQLIQSLFAQSRKLEDDDDEDDELGAAQELRTFRDASTRSGSMTNSSNNVVVVSAINNDNDGDHTSASNSSKLNVSHPRSVLHASSRETIPPVITVSGASLSKEKSDVTLSGSAVHRESREPHPTFDPYLATNVLRKTDGGSPVVRAQAPLAAPSQSMVNLTPIKTVTSTVPLSSAVTRTSSHPPL